MLSISYPCHGGTTLVISPLLALIADQVQKLTTLDLKVDRIHFGRSREDSRSAFRRYLNHELEFLFIAPEHAMRPFNQTRDGFLLGEGAAFLILEELTHALDRGAKIHAEVLGHGRSCEAYHSISPHPKGVGVSEAIEKAMELASLEKSQVQYINAHGTELLAVVGNN